MTTHSNLFNQINKQLDNETTSIIVKALADDKKIYNVITNYNKDNKSKSRTNPNYAKRNEFFDLCCTVWRNSLILSFDKIFTEAKIHPEILNKYFNNILKYHTSNELIKSFEEIKSFNNFNNEKYDELNTFHPNSINNLLIRFLDWKKDSQGYWTQCISNNIMLNSPNLETIEHRLYIPCEICHIDELALEISKRCFKDAQPFYFKYSPNKDRSDSFVIYSDTKSLNYFINILQDISQGRPYLFNSQNSPLVLAGKVFDGVYYGSEPKQSGIESFNTLREKAIIKAILNEILNFSSKYLNDNLIDNTTKKVLTNLKRSYSQEEFTRRKNLIYNQLFDSYITDDVIIPDEVMNINYRIKEILLDILESKNESLKKQTIEVFKSAILKEFDAVGIFPNNICFDKIREKSLIEFEKQSNFQNK